mgnify:CR=1 FL=1
MNRVHRGRRDPYAHCGPPVCVFVSAFGAFERSMRIARSQPGEGGIEHRTHKTKNRRIRFIRVIPSTRSARFLRRASLASFDALRLLRIYDRIYDPFDFAQGKQDLTITGEPDVIRISCKANPEAANYAN